MEVLGPITRLQSELIKWKFVSIIYPKNSSKNLLKLPIRNLRGQYGKSGSFSRHFKVSLRFVGLTNSTSVCIHGIPDDVTFYETSESSTGQTEKDFASALEDCEQIFLKQHIFKSTYPAISISYVHPSRVIEKTAIKGTTKKRGIKEVDNNKGRNKVSKTNSKIIYRQPVLAMYLY
uniref:Uncharacterized protein n=1 Tax=Pyropia pulchra TaxID=60925 RepID=O24668_9RHOD|nr:ORF1 [Pyropia pulchra]